MPASAAGPLTLPDYPHIATSNKFLYLITNEITAGPARWTGSVVRRMDLDDVADCLATVGDIFTFTGDPALCSPNDPGCLGVFDQRVAVPAEGATEEMAWGYLGDDDSSIRVYRWRDDAATPTSSLHTIQASNHANPDCRGGVGNYDFIQKSTAYSHAGFRMRSVFRKSTEWVAFWNVSRDASHIQGHIHGYRFRLKEGGATSKLGQFNIFNNNMCFGFPAVADNARGDIGLSIAVGDRECLEEFKKTPKP